MKKVKLASNFGKSVLSVRELPIIIYVVGLITVFSIMIPGFLSIKNFEIISRQISTIGIVSVGMTLVILTGGLDLSVGAILTFSVNIAGRAILLGCPIWIVYPLMLLLGMFLGSINGFIVTRTKVPAMIVTLGTMNVFRGLVMVLTKGKYLSPIPVEYEFVGKGYLPLIILILVFALFIFILSHTRFGRNLYAMGSAELSSLYSGVPVCRYKMRVYMLSGLLSALAGIILVGKSGFIQPQAGLNYELDAIAAVVIGGTSLTGGVGGIFGTLLGSILMGLILTGLTMFAVDPYWQGFITGLLILFAISVDSLKQMRR